MSYSVYFSFSKIFSFLAVIQVLQCAFLIFHVFECFSPYSRSYSGFVSFSTSFSFLAIIQVQHCVFHIFHVFQFSSHTPGPIVCISHISLFFTVPCHIPGPTVCVYYFTRFSVFLAIFHVLLFEFLIFLVCRLSSDIPGPTM